MSIQKPLFKDMEEGHDWLVLNCKTTNLEKAFNNLYRKNEDKYNNREDLIYNLVEESKDDLKFYSKDFLESDLNRIKEKIKERYKFLNKSLNSESYNDKEQLDNEFEYVDVLSDCVKEFCKPEFKNNIPLDNKTYKFINIVLKKLLNNYNFDSDNHKEISEIYVSWLVENGQFSKETHNEVKNVKDILVDYIDESNLRNRKFIKDEMKYDELSHKLYDIITKLLDKEREYFPYVSHQFEFEKFDSIFKTIYNETIVE